MKCGFDLHMNKDHAPLIGHCKDTFLNQLNFMDHVKNAHAKVNSRDGSKEVQRSTCDECKKSVV